MPFFVFVLNTLEPYPAGFMDELVAGTWDGGTITRRPVEQDSLAFVEVQYENDDQIVQSCIRSPQQTTWT